MHMTRIALVDDNSQVRSALKRCLGLNKEWTICWETDNGSSAIDMARRVEPDIMLLDYAMPMMNGIEAAREISAVAPHCAILLFTMFATPQLTELAKAAGVRAVFSKDVNGISELVGAIEAVAAEN
jgi:DNA-binding NarL/FixJ family response regulator